MRLSKTIVVGAAFAALMASARAEATAITYAASANTVDGTLSATAAFTTGAGFVQIVLTNTLAASAFVSPAQALSGISFTLSNNAGAVGALTASGQLGTFAQGTAVTYVAGSPTRWLGVGGGDFSVIGATVTLEAIGGGVPNQMIAPFVANGGNYPNDDSGVDNFVPYVIGPATFILNLSGVTASTTITAATFSFGVGPDHFVSGVVAQPVPEPASLSLFGVAMLGAGYRALRKRK